MRKFLLDTGIVLGYVRGAGYAEYVDKKFDIFANIPLVSVVTRGEIYSLAIQTTGAHPNLTSSMTSYEDFLSSISMKSKLLDVMLR